FEHISRVKVWIGRGDKIGIVGAKRCAFTMQHVALDAMWVELRAEEVALEFSAEARAAILHQPARCDAREFSHHRHQLACALELADGWMRFWIDAAFDKMHQRITLAVLRINKIGHRAEHLACRSKGQLDWIIEAAARYAFQPGAVRTAAPDARGQAF